MSFSVTPPVTGAINVYQYEDISYAFTYAGAVSYTTTGTTQLIANLVTATSSNVQFVSANYLGNSSTSEVLYVNATDASGNVYTQTYPVVINPGRFVTPLAGTLLNGGFYLNETFTPIRFQTKFLAINTPTQYVNNVPTSLPTGLQFVQVASNIYDLSGIPTTQSSLKNYTFLATGTSNSSYVVTTTASTIVNTERVIVKVSPSLTISNMTVGGYFDASSNIQPIPDRVITATYANSSPGNLQYTWSTLPTGVRFTDINGNTVSSGFLPFDVSSTLLMKVVPTADTVSQFRSANPFNISVFAKRLSLPIISNTSTLFSLSFARSVILDPPASFPTQYVGVPFRNDSVNPYFKAATYFGGTPASPIVSITSSNLQTSLTLNFDAPNQRAIISGFPVPGDVPGTTYTFRATNALGDYQDIYRAIAISNDLVTVTPSVSSATFIVSRPLTNPKTGYYPANIQFTASALSGSALTLTYTGLTNTGLSFSNVSSNVLQLVGTPTLAVSNQVVTVQATTSNVGGSSIYAYGTMTFSIVNDAFQFVTPTPGSNLTFYQNIPITPIQCTATTLSERSVTSFLASGLPPKLSLSPGGVLSGQDSGSTSGTFSLVASTGYSASTQAYSYTAIPDSILFLSAQSSYAVAAGQGVSIDVLGVSFSQLGVSNYQFVGLSNTYGLTMSSNGHIGGTLAGSLPTLCNFSIRAYSGSLAQDLGATLTPSSLSLNILPSGGPVFSMGSLPGTLYQYVAIQPITFQSTGTGTIYYYAPSLPTGFTFNPLTQTLQGTPIQTGTNKIMVFARDSVGTTSFTYTFNVIIPRVIKSQTGAGAYTSLVRQYTEVNGAENARDNTIDPSQSAGLGEFMSPTPSNVITQMNACSTSSSHKPC
jgi:hypothetical protein